MDKRFPLILLLLPLPLVTSACQRYSRLPLDLAEHGDRIARRDPAATEVVGYAERLAGEGRAPGWYDASDGLTLAEAEVVALFFNPELKLARLRADVPRVGAAEAGRWEDPELGVDAERIIESVERPWVLGGMLSFTVPLSGRLGVERKRAHSEASAAELRALAEERRVLAELRAEWANWSATVERSALTRQAVADVDSILGDVEQLRRAGEIGPVDARLLTLERVTQHAKLRGHEADAREAEVRIKARLGLSPAATVAIIPAIPVAAVQAGGEDDVTVLVAQHPRVRVARAEYEVAERTFELEIRKQYPDLRIGGGLGTDEGDERVVGGVALPLPLFNANRRAIAEARASREVARAAVQAEFEQLLAETAAAQVRLEADRERLKYVEKELAPLADQQLNDARRLAGLGEFETLVLLQAIQAGHEAKLAILDTRLSVTLSGARLNALLEGGGGSGNGGGDVDAAPASTTPREPQQ